MDIYSEIEYPISPGVACERLMGMLYSSNKIHIDMAVRMETKSRFGKKDRKKVEIIILLVMITIFMTFVCLFIGSSRMSISDCFRALANLSQKRFSHILPVLADIRRLIRKPSLTDWLTEVETV